MSSQPPAEPAHVSVQPWTGARCWVWSLREQAFPVAACGLPEEMNVGLSVSWPEMSEPSMSPRRMVPSCVLFHYLGFILKWLRAEALSRGLRTSLC